MTPARVARIALEGVGAGLGLLLAFVGAAFVAMALHLNVPLLRRVVASRVNAILASSFRGQLVIDSVGQIDFGGIDEGNVRILDPAGKVVAAAYGVRARISLHELLRSLVAGKGPLDVHLTEVSARAVDVELDIDEAGEVGIQRALASRTPSDPSTPGRAVRIVLDRVDVGHAWLHGTPVRGLPIDADVDSVQGAVHVDASRIALDATRFALTMRGMPLNANAQGTAEAHLTVPGPSGGGIGARVAWNGAVAGIAETATGSLDGEAFEATVDAPEVTPAAVRALWPASPIDTPATLHADVRGALPRLEIHVHTTHGQASFDATGPVVLGAGETAELHVDARQIDLHGIIGSLPPSRLSAAGDVSLARAASGALSAKAALDFGGGQIAGARVPPAKIHATFAADAKTGIRADATVNANEPGAPTVLSAHLRPRGRSFELTFDGDTHVAALDAVPRLGAVARGQSDLKTHGTLDFGRNQIDVSLTAEIRGLGHDVISAEHASVDARLQGSLSSPQIDATVHGDALDFGGYKFRAAEVEVHGPASHADVHVALDADGDGTPEMGVDGKVSIGSVTTIDQIRVHMAHARESVVMHVGQVRIAHGELAAEPVEVEGLGGLLKGAFHSSFSQAQIQLHGDGIDLTRFERVSRVQEGLGGCMAAVDIDLALRRDGADGHAALELTKCSLYKVEGGAAGVALTFDGRKIDGHAHAELADVGRIDLSTSKIEVGGTGTLPESWKKTFGRLKFDARFDAEKLAAKLPRHYVPLDHVRGILSIQGRVQRDSPTDGTPGLNLSVTTAGLEIVGPSTRTTGVDGTPVISVPTWRIDGIDFGADVRIDGDSGFAEVSTRLTDAKGELVAVDSKWGAIPYAAILDNPSRALALLEVVPVNTHVVVPPRDVRTLPPILALKGIDGTLEADAVGSGTLLAPTIDLKAELTKTRARQAVRFPLDLTLTGRYDGTRATATLVGVAKKGPVVDARVVANVRAADLLQGITSTWTASAQAHLDALELDSIAALDERQVSGAVTGDLKIDGVHEDGRATFALYLDTLKVGQVAYKKGALKATLDGKSFAAQLHVDQVDGSIDGTVEAATKWGSAVFPSLDPSRPPSGEVKAKSFRLALLLPFVDSSFTALDGLIDADLKATIDSGSGQTKPQGTVLLSHGRFELASIGGEFHDVTAKATFTPDGVVKLEGVKASAMSGVVEAAATARMRGLALEGANAAIVIPPSRPLLLTVQGAQVGTVDGVINVAISETTSTINVKVEIPRLHVELPRTNSRDVQALGEMDGVHIGLEKGPGGFVAQRLDAPKEAVVAPAGKTITASFALGNDVVVKKSTQLSVGLAGTPVITIGTSVAASGQVRLVSGKIDVQGKSFDIDNGAVTFQGDPSDPQLVITASWTAADGTQVYADLRGSLKKPVVTLRSEPAYPRDQIVALLLYGSADATSPNSAAAAGVAGGAATQPLNRALENMGLGGVSTRVDTSSVTPRADVEVQIARDLSLQVAEVMGVPPPGTSQDTTLFTVSWRFARAWSAETTIGIAGTTILDLIWQHRY